MLELAATLAFAAAVFFHWRIGRLTATRARSLTAHAIVGALGLGVGYVAMSTLGADPVASFVFGFGLTHVPPALVLLLKGWRGEQPS